MTLAVRHISRRIRPGARSATQVSALLRCHHYSGAVTIPQDPSSEQTHPPPGTKESSSDVSPEKPKCQTGRGEVGKSSEAQPLLQHLDPSPQGSDSKHQSQKPNEPLPPHMLQGQASPPKGVPGDLEGSIFADLSLKPNSPLIKRRGITAFLNLRELSKPPGMVFKLEDSSLSVEKGFASRLHYVKDPKHHQLKRWIAKALIQRAEAWLELDLMDFRRLRKLPSLGNCTHLRHRGNARSHAKTIHGLAARSQRAQKYLLCTRWPDNIGPSLSGQPFGHLDGMYPEDVQVLTETQKHPPNGPELLTCIWVVVNAPYRLARLAFGRGPLHPDLDTFGPVMSNFHRWLSSRWCSENIPNGTMTRQKQPRQYPYDATPQPNNAVELQSPPRFQDMVPEGRIVPVIFAWRHKYIWFTWEGGIKGKLVAQYASHWLPIHESKKVGDLDSRISAIQKSILRKTQTSERAGAA